MNDEKKQVAPESEIEIEDLNMAAASSCTSTIGTASSIQM